jgi:hypothetical protein
MMIGHALEAMAASNAVLVASGTATLEAALLKRPMVITYKVSRLSYWILRDERISRFLGLPNILAGEQIVPSSFRTPPRPKHSARRCSRCCATKACAKRSTRASKEYGGRCGRTPAEKAAAAIMPLLERAGVAHRELRDECLERGLFALGKDERGASRTCAFQCLVITFVPLACEMSRAERARFNGIVAGVRLAQHSHVAADGARR